MSRTEPRPEALRLTRLFHVPRSRVFRAWTDPEELRKWWQLGHGWKLTVAKIDLKVGGEYRIGLDATQSDTKHTVTGTFQEVSVPNRLVYTWSAGDPQRKEEESLVTVEFRDKGGNTELILKHEKLTGRELRQNTYDGWLMVLDGLTRMLSEQF